MYDITFLGNAPVDVLMHVPDDVLAKHNLNKGDWLEVSPTVMDDILKDIPEERRELKPGGSVANSADSFASLGGKGYLCAYVGDDTEGQVFYKAHKDKGIAMPAPVTGKRTLVIYVLITPDGERTFVAPSGDKGGKSRAKIGAEGLQEAAIASSDWLLVEGYLFADDFPSILKACQIARKNGTKIAITLAAPSFVKNHFSEIVLLVRDGIDLYICNEEELRTLKEAQLTGDDEQHAEETLAKLRQVPHLVTFGKKGATYQDPGEKTHVPTQEAESIVDATGAGDAFAAGYFYGMSKGYEREGAIALGHTLAGKVIQQVGGRLPAEAFSGL